MNKLIVAAALLCAHTAWASATGTEWVNGEIVKLDPAHGKIVLKHAPIKMVKMKAMTMPFLLANPATAEPLRVGQKVRFEVHLHDDQLVVHRVEVRP